MRFARQVQRRQAVLAKRYAGRILPPHTTGHGETTYVPVEQTNMLASEDDRGARRAVLLDRDRKSQQYVAALRRSLAARPSRVERPKRTQRHTPPDADSRKRSRGRLCKMRPTRTIRKQRVA